MTTSLLAAVRIEIGDTEEGQGVLPGRRHFQEEEIQYAAETEAVTELSTPSQRDIGRVSAKCLEIASVAWSSQPEEVELGPSIEKGKQALRLGRQASILRAIWGYGGSGGKKTEMKAPAYIGLGMIPLPPGIS